MACFNTWTPKTFTVFSQEYRIVMKDCNTFVLWGKREKSAMPRQKL